MTEPRIYHEAIPYSRRTQSEKTADLPADEVRHLTSFDQELVHGMVELGVGFSHGRQLAHGPDGALYLVTESAVRGLLISGAASPAPRSECFTAPVALVGIAEDGPLGRATGLPGGASLAMAADGSTALCWHDETGVWLARGTAGAPALTVEALDAQTARPLPGYTAARIAIPGDQRAPSASGLPILSRSTLPPAARSARPGLPARWPYTHNR